MSSRPLVRSGLALLAAAVLSAGCTSTAAGPAASAGGSARSVTAGSAHPAPTGTPAPSGGPAGVAAASAGAVPHPADPLAGRQFVTVTAASYGATYAAFTAYQRTGGRWRRIFGPWTARIGRNGFAPPGLKREGDGRTPSGTFRFGFFFGVQPDPGVRFAYRQSQPYNYWDDDPASPLYNEWVDQRRASPGLNPEPMDVSGYDYGAVIAYNTARTPGLGSAIFLHVNIGIATAGCVTLPSGELLRVLRWLDPARSPRIRMGVG
jgi:L,D-peptidoglycan transpeptidase YkuD (ErfK/YbiS/YcfS/YnhG family)